MCLCSLSSINWHRPLAAKVTVYRSGVALAMRHRVSGISTYGLNGLGKGDEALFGVLWHLYQSLLEPQELMCFSCVRTIDQIPC